MKRLPFILLCLPALLWAKPVSMNQAQQVAEKFINSTDESLSSPSVTKPRHLKRVAKQVTDASPFYIFNNEDGGFVIVAGDDCATPILGYSDAGYIDLDNMPIQLEELLNAYALEIQEAVDNNLQATDDVAEDWKAFNKAPQTKKTTAIVNALISTKWSQYPRYNALCPSDASLSSLGGHPSTGCVATAMAQIMKYWEYPKKGIGSKSYRSDYYGTLSANFALTEYEWENMPIQLSSSTSDIQNNAVATLMYHCGIAVSMGYNADGKGGSTANTIYWGGNRPSAETALKEYFGYVTTLSGKTWEQSTSVSTWSKMLKTELDNKRPVLYRGVSSQGGHAFICDGYDSNNKFHFNWGWDGKSDGFYALTAGTSGCHNFTKDQCAVIGIKPKGGSGPAKNYDLYMNTDLTATNTSNTGSTADLDTYSFGKNLSFTAKVENNGTGAFEGSLRVAIYTYDGSDGEFVAWSNESPHVSIGAGKKTELQTFTFDGGYPFMPGKYHAYLFYQDDDETTWKPVKTDKGVLFTEYNNIIFCVKVLSGDLFTYSKFIPDEIYGTYISGSRLKIHVDVKNTALLTKFYGKIRLNLYNTDGTNAQTIEELDFTKNGLSASTIYNLVFDNYIAVAPGTYYMALVYQEKNKTSWYYMRSSDAYSNPAEVIIKARPLYADNYEVNDTQEGATIIPWEIDEELADFTTDMVSLHIETDIDYYKLIFPDTSRYQVTVSLYDKYNNQGQGYKNAEAQYAYSLGGDDYYECDKDNQVISFKGPQTLYFIVLPDGMSGLGYYELTGNIVEISQRADCKSLPYTESFASSQGEFSVYNAILPSGFTSIWKWNSQYGMVAKCINGSTKYESKAYLVSPCIEIPDEGQTFLTFRHAAKFYQNTSQMTLWVSTDYDIKNPSAAHWTQMCIPTYPPGTNWTWYDSGLIDLSEYRGQYLNVAFLYTSTTNYAPQWEIKDFSMQVIGNDIENVHMDSNFPTKILHEGQIYILRGNNIYTITGQLVK